MKRILLFRLMIFCGIMLPFISMAQKPLSQLKIKAKKTVNLKTMRSTESDALIAAPQTQMILKKINARFNLSQERNTQSALLPGLLSGSQLSWDGASSTEKTAASSPPPVNDFKGLKDNGTVYPPDPGGAAGPDYIMHVSNQKYVIYDKSGSVVLSLPVDTFWSAFAGAAQAFAYPHVEYDAQLNHFYISSLAADASTGDYAELFGVSDSDDPTGSWTLYEFDFGPDFIQDAPLIGYSKRWFTITTIQYDTAAPNNFNSAGVYLMSLSNLIAGTLSNIYFISDSNFFSISPVETLDPNINNHYLVSNYGSSADTGYLFELHIGGSLTAPTYNYDGFVKKNQPWTATPVYAPQNGTTKKIYAGSTKLTNAVYRNGKIWTSHTVYLPQTAPTRAAVQWWQFDAASRKVSQFNRVQDKAGAAFYAYPSISVNSNNDMLLGFNKFSTTTYASAAYAYRNGSDAANALRKPRVYKDGKNVYFAGGSAGVTFNWGSYTATSVDPSDNSFWTIQEYAEKKADTWGTWWAHVDDVALRVAAQDKKQTLIIISPNPAKNIAALSWNEEKATNVKIQVSGAQGNVLLTRDFTTQKGINKVSVNIANLIAGVYTVTVLNGTEIKKAQLVVE